MTIDNYTPIPRRVKDITGDRYGRLVAVSFAFIDGRGAARWDCICDCGKTVTVRAAALKSANNKSCGCLAKSGIKKVQAKKRTNRKASVRKDGNTKDLKQMPEYGSWRAMKNRCLLKTDEYYHLYGGRGIGLCERWLDFWNFYEDMGDKPTPQHTIDRIDNNGNYEPGNCRWATIKEQSNNRKSNKRLTMNGETKTLTQWSEEYGIHQDTVNYRLRSGWSLEDALTIPPGTKRKTANRS